MEIRRMVMALDSAKRCSGRSEYGGVRGKLCGLTSSLLLSVLVLSTPVANASHVPEGTATGRPRPSAKAALSPADLSSRAQVAVGREPASERLQPHTRARQIGRPKVFPTRLRVLGVGNSCANDVPSCTGYCGANESCKGLGATPECPGVFTSCYCG